MTRENCFALSADSSNISGFFKFKNFPKSSIDELEINHRKFGSTIFMNLSKKRIKRNLSPPAGGNGN